MSTCSPSYFFLMSDALHMSVVNVASPYATHLFTYKAMGNDNIKCIRHKGKTIIGSNSNVKSKIRCTGNLLHALLLFLCAFHFSSKPCWFFFCLSLAFPPFFSAFFGALLMYLFLLSPSPILFSSIPFGIDSFMVGASFCGETKGVFLLLPRGSCASI